MRADVPVTIELEQQPHGLAAADFAADAPAVAITSWSALTVFGDLAETWDHLLSGNCIDDHKRVPSHGATGRAMMLARSVASQALAERTVDRDIGVIVGTSKGSVEGWFIPPPGHSTPDIPTGGLAISGLGDIAAELARACRTRGPVLTTSAACASGLHALIRGTMMIRSGQVRQALIVAAEASVHPLILASFQRLGILAKPGDGCRPFDRDRTGFYVSEAACAVLLEAAEFPSSSGINVERYALGSDATHLTGGDPDARTLKHLLRRVIRDDSIDLIHAHGTGTVMNDGIELGAIEQTVGDWPRRPIVYSHKAALGHSLGASGLLSVVLNCQSHATGLIPPNPRTTQPLPAQRVVIPSAATRRPVRRSVAMAAGFGGSVAVVSLVRR